MHGRMETLITEKLRISIQFKSRLYGRKSLEELSRFTAHTLTAPLTIATHNAENKTCSCPQLSLRRYHQIDTDHRIYQEMRRVLYLPKCDPFFLKPGYECKFTFISKKHLEFLL